MARIKFKRFGSSTFFGSFAPGDSATVSDSVAAHFVDNDMADFLEDPRQSTKPVETQAPEAIQAPARGRPRKKVDQ